MTDPIEQDFSDNSYADDQNDALRREDAVDEIKEISGDDENIEVDKDRLAQADEASRPSYELDLDADDKPDR